MKQNILSILEQLVACDTQNPPRNICADGKLFQFLRLSLGESFEFHVQDFGKGRVNLLAIRGQPTRLFNVHLDTVPIGNEADWSKPPLQLTIESEKVFGRGVCDIKGAAACLITAAGQTASDVAVLFSTDEEGAESCCVREFCDSELANPFSEVIVAEPTECLAVVGHRGYLSVTMGFCGKAGHTSQRHLLKDSANHRAAMWVARALQKNDAVESSSLDNQSTCFNIGRIDGGIKNNMVADHCRVTWSARLPAGSSNELLIEDLISRTSNSRTPEFLEWHVTFDGPPLPGDLTQRENTRQLCKKLSLDIGRDVDFWTEAALFAETGRSTFVLGPGNIAQAHTVDEWVAIDQLERCAGLYADVMNSN